MNVIDPIADLLTRVRNAIHANREVVTVPASKQKIAITHLLKEEGYIKAYKCVKDDKQGLIKIALKYNELSEGANTRSALTSLKRESKPSKRRYVTCAEIPYVKNGFGIGLLSTSQGIMTCREARKRKIGGEYLCSVY